MRYNFFSRNGVILPIEQAVVSLGSIEYAYGFGVYETIRVTNGRIEFLDKHCERLMQSAEIIRLGHTFSVAFTADAVTALVAKLQPGTCNVKILLVGGSSDEAASLNIMCLNPLFPNRKLYKQGADLITYNYERVFPHAKTLNMLQSYLAYREASAHGAYDALLVNRDGCITEGTRTNFCCMQGQTIISPPEDSILLGVMRSAAFAAARTLGFTVEQRPLPLNDLRKYETAFITSTSTKILPVHAIDDQVFGPPTPQLRQLMAALNKLLESL